MATLAACGVVAAGSGAGITKLNTSSCKKAGGILDIVIFDGNDIDLAASYANYNGTTSKLSALAMVGASVGFKIETDGGETTFTSVKQDNGNYLNTVTMYFKGTSCERQNAIRKLDGLCPKVIWVRQADCTQFISLEVGAASLSLPTASNVEIATDSLTAGTVDGDSSSQTLTITWTGSPMCATFTDIAL